MPASTHEAPQYSESQFLAQGERKASTKASPVLTEKMLSIKASFEATLWKAKWFQVAPLMGLACLCLAVLCIVASAIILRMSDNDALTNWKYQPSVYFSILTAVANLSVRFAALEGAAIWWWTRALRGTTMAHLHHNWAMGFSVSGVLRAGRHLNVVAAACICATLVAIDGPLLQRASSVTVASMSGEAVQLSATISPEVPTGYSGIVQWVDGVTSSDPYDGRQLLGQWSATFSDTFQPVAEGFVLKAPLDNFVAGCPSQCKATVRAPAVAATACTSHIVPKDHADLVSIGRNNSAVTQMNNPKQQQTGLAVFLQLIEGTVELLNVTFAVADTVNCTGTVNFTSCLLQPSVGEYDVLVSGEKLTFTSGTVTPRIVALANNTGAGSGNAEIGPYGGNSILSGMWMVLIQ